MTVGRACLFLLSALLSLTAAGGEHTTGVTGSRGPRASYPRHPNSNSGGVRTPGAVGPRLTDVTDGSVWPAPAYETHAQPGTWKELGVNEGAVSGDCPFLAHGSGTTLTACQSNCDGAPSCNLINFNPTLPDCVLRSCSDPFHPILTPTPGYDVWGVNKASYAIHSVGFEFFVNGFVNPTLTAALTRYSKYNFPYPPPRNSSLFDERVNGVKGIIKGLTVTVLSHHTSLNLDTDESYNITINSDIPPIPSSKAFASTLVAYTVYGALRGLETFSQLIQYNSTSGVYFMAGGAVEDKPRFAFRGLMVDPSRHFLTVPVYYYILDVMAAVKLNVLHIHLTDDQSWPVVIPQYPNLTQISAFSQTAHTYSPKQLASIVSYGLERGIRVIPEIDTPSHTGAMTQAYPDIAALAFDSNNNSFPCLVDPSKESTFTFIANIFAELSTVFPDIAFHIGGDEVWSCWTQSPTVSKWMEEQGFDFIHAYWYYERRIIDIARSLNKTVIAWEDINGYPENFNVTHSYNNYPDVALAVWTGCYSGNWQSDVSQFTSQNSSVIVSGPFYITQTNGAPNTPHFTWDQMYAVDLWNFTGNTSVARSHVLGGLLAAWGDATESDSADVYMEITPYIFGVSEAWWSPQEFVNAAVVSGGPDGSRAHGERCRMLQRGLASHPLFGLPYEPVHCVFEYQPQEITPTY